MTGPAHPNRCRTHGLTLTPDGVCTECYWLDRLQLHTDFSRIVAPLRAEGGPFAKTPRLGDIR